MGVNKLTPTIAGIEEEIRLLKIDAKEPILPGQVQRKNMKITEWIMARMKAAANANT